MTRFEPENRSALVSSAAGDERRRPASHPLLGGRRAPRPAPPLVPALPPHRTATCRTCGRGFEAGRRGPLPRLCQRCRIGVEPVRVLRDRISTARNLALTQERSDVVSHLERALELVDPTWTRNGE